MKVYAKILSSMPVCRSSVIGMSSVLVIGAGHRYGKSVGIIGHWLAIGLSSAPKCDREFMKEVNVKTGKIYGPKVLDIKNLSSV